MDVKALRLAHQMNQADFWCAVGITQSGGSRYEHERNMPESVRALLTLRYVLGIDFTLINPGNAPAVRALLAGELDSAKLTARAKLAGELVASLCSVAEQAKRLAGGE